MALLFKIQVYVFKMKLCCFTTAIILIMTCNMYKISAKRIHVKVNCGQFEEIFDELGIASGITFVTDKYLRPTSDTDLDKRCPEILDAIVTLRLYNKRCQTSLTQQVLSAILKSRHVYYKAICQSRGTDSIKMRYRGIKCFQERAKKEFRSAEERSIVILEAISESNIESFIEKNLHFCCTFKNQKKHIREVGQEAKCDEYIPNLLSYIDSYFAQVLDVICPDLTDDEEDICGKLKPLNIDKVKPHYRFMLNPVVRAVKAMENNEL